MVINLYKIGLALIIGLFIGYEREKADKPAGLRSCVLVIISMTFLMILNLRLLDLFGITGLDMARIPSYCIAGIGFLGSGVIILNKKGIEGVTTASTLLALVVIGLLCGLGEFLLASIMGSITFLVLNLKYIEVKLKKDNK